MILVDTSVIAGWIDPAHPHHPECEKALLHWANQDDLAISALTYAELAAGGRTREALDEILAGFIRIDFDFYAAFRAGQAFSRCNPGKKKKPHRNAVYSSSFELTVETAERPGFVDFQ
jgi:predicted nucleic acid-binding protein